MGQCAALQRFRVPRFAFRRCCVSACRHSSVICFSVSAYRVLRFAVAVSRRAGIPTFYVSPF
eukprot:1802402-Alexandrium_andersonii.AAC.1